MTNMRPLESRGAVLVVGWTAGPGRRQQSGRSGPRRPTTWVCSAMNRRFRLLAAAVLLVAAGLTALLPTRRRSAPPATLRMPAT